MLGEIIVRQASATLLLLLAISCSGCAKDCAGCDPRPPARRPSVSTQSSQPVSTDPAAAEKSLPTEDPRLADAMRRRDFQVAARIIDAAPQSLQKRPEVQYARAISALALGDPDRALTLAQALEKETPPFAGRANQIVLEVARQKRDALVLSHLFTTRAQPTSPEDRLLLAQAHIETGEPAEGEAILSELIRSLDAKKESDRGLLARAYLERAKVQNARGQKREAARDFLWLATEGVGTVEADDADRIAEELDPSRLLTKAERLTRARAFSEAGSRGRVEAELLKLKNAPGPPPPPQVVAFLRAWSVYTARADYPAAAALFAAAAELAGSERDKNLYYQAKSLARASRHQDAIQIYDRLARGGPYADPAAYEWAKLQHLDAHWKLAIGGYERYLRNFRSGTKKALVLADLPVARLAAKSPALARREFAQLAQKTTDARERARLLELEAVASSDAKDPAQADALFRRVIQEAPLSLPALFSAEHLRALDRPVPPLLPPYSGGAETSPLPTLHLPDLVERLQRVGLDEEAERALEAEEPSLKKRYGDRAPEVLCRLYGFLESAKRRYQIAQTAATQKALLAEPLGSGRWQWDCAYPRPYEDIVRREAKERGVPEALVYAIIRQESAFRPSAVSSAKAVGLMQIIPATARRIGEEIGEEYRPELMSVPAINIRFGVYYLGKLLRMFQGRADLAAAAYNAGPRAVARWLASLHDLPTDLFVASIPYEETRNYVYRVMSNYARYAYLSDDATPAVSLSLPAGLHVPEEAY